MKTKLLIMATFAVACTFAFLGCDVNKNANGIKAFSVDKEKQVIFSKGNLQYHPLNNEWRFAPNQTDYVGDANSNVAPNYEGWLDLFGWSTSSTNFGVSTSKLVNDYSGSFVDWGANQIGEDVANTWRTLSKEEWEYLLNNRTHARCLKGAANVNGVNGLIILPDNWKTPEGIKFKSRFHRNKSEDAYSKHQTLTAEQWSILEQAGAIFLPAATYGHYWTSTKVDEYSSNHFYLFPNEVGVGYCSRNVGMSVRLVKDL